MQQKKKVVKKKVLKVSDIYSESEEENVEDKEQTVVTLKEKVDFNDLKTGAFVVVTFSVGRKKTSKDYAAIIQDVSNIDEGEINVMFFKNAGVMALFSSPTKMMSPTSQFTKLNAFCLSLTY